jgi:hypothetical protein
MINVAQPLDYRCTRLRVESATDGTLRITKETVARETPASAAMSRRVTRCFGSACIRGVTLGRDGNGRKRGGQNSICLDRSTTGKPIFRTWQVNSFRLLGVFLWIDLD